MKYLSNVTVVVRRLSGHNGYEEELLCHPDTAKFRPIRTPEQIAEEIRHKEINELAEYISAWSCDTLPLPRHMHLASHLYEHRYRKQVAP